MFFKNAYVGSKEKRNTWKRLFQSQVVSERREGDGWRGTPRGLLGSWQCADFFFFFDLSGGYHICSL